MMKPVRDGSVRFLGGAPLGFHFGSDEASRPPPAVFVFDIRNEPISRVQVNRAVHIGVTEGKGLDDYIPIKQLSRKFPGLTLLR